VILTATRGLEHWSNHSDATSLTPPLKRRQCSAPWPQGEGWHSELSCHISLYWRWKWSTT